MRKLFILGLLLAALSSARDVVWTASWINAPNTPTQDYGVFHFRKTFELSAKPASFVIHVSGDNRYRLYANGQSVSAGPARGDLTHWRYETVDIASRLQAGKNVLAAVAWNDGPGRSIAQVTNQTGFLLQADTAENAVANTGKTWRCVTDTAYTPQPLPAGQRTGYYALAANERVDGAKYPWGWESNGFDDSTWQPAHEITRAAARDQRDAPNRWMLVPSEIPPEEQTLERLQTYRKAEGVQATNGFLQGKGSLTIPAHTAATLLLDQSYLTTAYPQITLSEGPGASISLQYAEALFNVPQPNQPHTKGNRNDIEGKVFLGPSDTYLSDGGTHRTYAPLFWRTYRYIQLSVTTSGQPLIIEDLHGTFTGYPFQRKASFELKDSGQNAEVQRILSTGFHTARLCAHETYMDCPFYEQLQYSGDARIQMLVSLYTTGDARLMKNGIALLNSSRTSEGATYSRAPSNLQQYIPPFSLWWIGMVHDYWMFVDDAPFAKQMLTGVRAVLDFYADYRKPNGSLTHMPWWNFVDWVKQWPNGEPPAEADRSSSAALDLQLLLAYRWGADREKALGSPALSSEYTGAADRLQATIAQTDWDESRGLFADQPSHKTYSQQVNTLAVLAHVANPARRRAIMQKVITDASLAQSSIYFRAYTNAALREVGMGDQYLELLGPWRDMLGQGLTTWAEWNGADTRSDCHAWGASPNFEVFRTIAGIESAGPGFRQVRIAPNLGESRHVAASMPHPRGEIKVDLQRKGAAGLDAQIELPAGVTGRLEWAGKTQPVAAGKNHLEVQ